MRKMKRKANTEIMNMESAASGMIVGSSGNQQQHHEGGQGLPEDLVLEVLSRVRKVKDLNQYKCVSKAWKSIISSPRFYDAYRNHHRLGGLLMSVVQHQFGGEEKRTGPVQVRFLYSTLLPCDGVKKPKIEEPEQFFCRFKVPAGSRYFRGYTEVVDGLACVYEQEGGEGRGVIVCNVCTGQTMRLPDNDFNAYGTRCFLGYDPSNRVYKLFKLFTTQRVRTAQGGGGEGEGEAHNICRAHGIGDCRCRFEAQLECEILTLGHDSSWRKLGIGFPLVSIGRPVSPPTQSLFVLVNGVVYLLMRCRVDDPPILISFDLSKEEFRSIKPPQDPLVLLNQLDWVLVQFMGRPSLSSPTITGVPGSILLYVLEDDDGDSWSSHAISLPILPEIPVGGLATPCVAFPAGNLPTGQILFAILIFHLESDCSFTHVYSYDHRKSTFDRLLVGGDLDTLSVSDRKPDTYSCLRITCLEENITPLEVLFSSGG